VLAATQRPRRDTGRGLVALRLTSGGWALAHVAFLVARTTRLNLASYYVGLILGPRGDVEGDVEFDPWE